MLTICSVYFIEIKTLNFDVFFLISYCCKSYNVEANSGIPAISLQFQNTANSDLPSKEADIRERCFDSGVYAKISSSMPCESKTRRGVPLRRSCERKTSLPNQLRLDCKMELSGTYCPQSCTTREAIV